MKLKDNLKTVRLSSTEAKMVDQFIEQNPAIDNFSSLARIAILDLIAKKGSITLRPLVQEEAGKKPSFLWDYDLGESQIREILSGPLEQRKWLVAKILEHAKFDEVWKYLTPRDVERDLPSLRLNPKTREHWAFAVKIWREMR